MLRYFLSKAARESGLVFLQPREGDAGFDIQSLETKSILPREAVCISTGLYIAVPLGWVGLIKDRSSMASGLILTHGGVIDAGYRGEVKVIISNQGQELYRIESGQKIAQLIVVPCHTECFLAEDIIHLGDTARGHSGFGSTGK